MRWRRWLVRKFCLPPGPEVTLPRLAITRYRVLLGMLVTALIVCLVMLGQVRTKLIRSERILGQMTVIAESSESLAELYGAQINNHVTMNALWSRVQQSEGAERARVLAQYHLAVADYNDRTRAVIAHCDEIKRAVEALAPLLEDDR